MQIKSIRQQDLPFRFVYIDQYGEITKRSLVTANKSGIYIEGSQDGEDIVKTYRIDRIQKIIESDYEWNSCPYSEPYYSTKETDYYSAPNNGYNNSASTGINAMFNFEKKLKAQMSNKETNKAEAKNVKTKAKGTKKELIIGLIAVLIILYLIF